MSEEPFIFDCQGKHLQVGNRCMKCGAHIIDFGDYNEGYLTGWKRMEGTIDYTHAPKELKEKLGIEG